MGRARGPTTVGVTATRSRTLSAASVWPSLQFAAAADAPAITHSRVAYAQTALAALEAEIPEPLSPLRQTLCAALVCQALRAPICSDRERVAFYYRHLRALIGERAHVDADAAALALANSQLPPGCSPANVAEGFLGALALGAVPPARAPAHTPPEFVAADAHLLAQLAAYEARGRAILAWAGGRGPAPVRAASGRWDESTTVVMKVAERLLLRETVNDAPALAAYREHFADAWARYGPTLWAASAPAAGALVLPVFDEQLWAETQLCMVRGNGLINADLFAPGADPGWLGCAPMSTVMLSPQVAAAAVAAHRRGRLEPVLAHELIHTPQQGRQERHEKEAVTETTTRELLPAGDYIPQSYLWEVAAFDGIAAVCGLPARTLALGAQRRMVAGEDGALAAELAASWPAAAALSDRQIQDALDGAFVSDPRPSPADASARARAYFKRATMFATNDLA